jgi:hypothetical protein
MRRIIALAAGAAMLAAPAGADEIEETIAAALEAYRAGDVALAKEELDYAATLLGQLKAESLAGFLPEPLPGWTREEGDTSRGMAGFGGGMAASAVYEREGAGIEIQLMAENQIVASMGMMLQNPAMMGAMGTVKRIGRQMVLVTPEGEVQAMVGPSVLVQISGDGAVEDKLAYLEAMDLEALKAF